MVLVISSKRLRNSFMPSSVTAFDSAVGAALRRRAALSKRWSRAAVSFPESTPGTSLVPGCLPADFVARDLRILGTFAGRLSPGSGGIDVPPGFSLSMNVIYVVSHRTECSLAVASKNQMADARRGENCAWKIGRAHV